MIVKLFEVRDRMTFIPAIAIQLSDEDGYLARRAGYGPKCILFGRATGGKFYNDPYEWEDRTMRSSHLWLETNFDSAASGSIVDVEFILGESQSPKISERLEVKA